MAHAMLYDYCDFKEYNKKNFSSYSSICFFENDFNSLGIKKIKIREVSNLPVFVFTDDKDLCLLKLLENDDFFIFSRLVDSKYLKSCILPVIKAKYEKIHITNKEKEILYMLKLGYNSSKIISRLGISYKTLSTHKRNLFLKLSVHTSYQLMLWAIKNI